MTTGATVFVVKTNGLGISDAQALREELAKSYLTLALDQKVVHLISCQTCLNAFNLTDQIRVGIVGCMGDIMTAMWQKEKVLMV